MIRGRFAPSPTGPLHFGSLLAAVGSYLHAKSQGGEWLLRIEDLDPPREQAGASDQILRCLQAYGLHWDGEVMYQSHRSAAYEAALQQLAQQELVYYCRCSRKELGTGMAKGAHGSPYPGTCRRFTQVRDNASVRVRSNDQTISFVDQCLGQISQGMDTDVGDFIIRRRDGLIAYQLAVVVDDAAQGITDIVRGSDLLDSTPRQIYLQQLLQLPTPRYLHLPLALNAQQHKLSKQTAARPIDIQRPVDTLYAALEFLGQQPPASLRRETLSNLLAWARSNWSITKIPATARVYDDEAECGTKR